MICLILDAHLHSALSAIRSLGKNDCTVYAASDTLLAPGFFSRFTKKRFVYPSPLSDQHAFLEKIIAIGKDISSDCLLYIFSEATLLSLSRNREKLPANIHLVLGSLDAVELASDKAAILKLASQVSIPIPKTYYPETRDDTEKILGNLSFPCVIKPRHNCVWKKNISSYETVHIVESKSIALKTWSDLYTRLDEPPLIQEKVVGDERGIFSFAVNGMGHSWFAHKRLESLSSIGGASVLRESIPVDETLKQYSELLIKKLAWTGPLMIEWKWSESEKKYVLMEINARLWGSLPLSVAAGVNYPKIMVDFADSKIIPKKTSYVSGLRSRHFFGVLKSLFRLKNLKNFRKVWRNAFSGQVVDDVASLSDPFPFIGEMLFMTKKLLWKK